MWSTQNYVVLIFLMMLSENRINHTKVNKTARKAIEELQQQEEEWEKNYNLTLTLSIHSSVEMKTSVKRWLVDDGFIDSLVKWDAVVQLGLIKFSFSTLSSFPVLIQGLVNEKYTNSPSLFYFIISYSFFFDIWSGCWLACCIES